MIATAIFVLFSISLSIAMPTSRSEPTFSHIFFPNTGQFLRFMDDGTVTANGQYGHQSQIIIHYLADEQVRLQYMMVSKDCFLVYENGQFHGSTPRKGNEIFQREETGSGNVALRLVNYVTDEEEGSAGSGAGVEQPSNSTTSTSEEPTNSTEQGDATTEAPTTTTDATTATTEATTATTEATTEASEQTTSTQEPRATVCYLGFPDAESAPRCYDSKENQATHFRII